MPKGKGTYGSKKGRPKKPNAHRLMKFKDQKGTSDGITMADVVSARKDGYNPKLYKPQMNKGPYMMKPGRESATRNTPGPFRAEVSYMYNTRNAIKPMMTDSDKVLSEMSINRSLAGRAASGTKKRTMAGRSLKSAGKVNVESSKPGVKIVEKAKPVSIPKPVKKQGKSSFEDRARKAVGAPSKRAARKMKLR